MIDFSAVKDFVAVSRWQTQSFWSPALFFGQHQDALQMPTFFALSPFVKYGGASEALFSISTRQLKQSQQQKGMQEGENQNAFWANPIRSDASGCGGDRTYGFTEPSPCGVP